jgi:NADH:ubiquinone oxidoreductase subunit
MTIGTWLFTKMRGELVGTDAEGNRYFRTSASSRSSARWVMYNGVAEAARSARLAWLLFTTNTLPPAVARRARPGRRITCQPHRH